MDQTTSTVSVLIPTYNRGHYIEECLDSILKQTVPPLEIIVIDDGSDDDTAERLQHYQGRISYIKKENGGKSKALNLMLNQVKGDYIWLFDDDDVALPDAIENRLKLFLEDPGLDVAYSAHFYGIDGPDGKIQVTDRYSLPEVPEDDFFFHLLCGCFFTQPGILFHRRCLHEGDNFDYQLLRSQDYDFMVNLARHGKFKGVNEPSYIIRRHPGLRGPKQDAHDAQMRDQAWLKYDGIIGQKIRASLDLSEYLPANAHPNQRLALFRRMAVMASKGLANEMLADLTLAMAASAAAFSPEELQLCRQAISYPYFLMRLGLDQDNFLMALGALAKANPQQAKPLLGAFSRGLLWLVRQPGITFAERIGYLRFLLALGKTYAISA